MESDGEGINAEGLAIDDSCPSPEITRDGPQIQPFVPLPGIAGNHPGTVGAYVLRQGFLGRMADIETTEIDSDGESNTILHSARNSLHGTPHGRTQMG
jgi:hypothetical protein